MARLRRDSAENTGFRKEASSRQTNQILLPRNSRTRTSPRKKIPKAPVLVLSSDEDDTPRSESGTNLTPKVLPQKAARGRQIRLAPLDPLKETAPALTLRFSDDKAEKNERSRLRNVPAGQPGRTNRCRPTPSRLSDTESQHIFPTSDASPEIDEVTSDREEAQVEESIWCGSDAASESSDDELPSPRKFIRPLQKTSTTTVAPPARPLHNICVDLQGLHLSQSNSASQRQLSQFDSSSRPTTSSDKENDYKAILRFSPPRLHSPKRSTPPERPSTPPPCSPSKGKLMSPSKRAPRVPTPPLRPSLDTFWNAETVNEWNDQYSPKKDWKSPRKLKLLSEDASTSPTSSPRKSPTKRTKAEIQAKQDWESRKHEVAEAFLAELDYTVAQGRLQALAASSGGIRFIWSKTLNSTAGRANWKRETTKTRQPDGGTATLQKHFASIELAEKVIDDEDRLLNVIAHEFCHLCNFMISGIKDQPHGRQFKEWGRKCTAAFRDRGVEVTTKHTYEIDYKYIWRCSNEDCAAEFKRHSKSIDLKRHTCGSCHSQLLQIKPVPRKANGGAATGYAAFVKDNFAQVKASLPAGTSHKEVMGAVAKRYQAEKTNTASKALPAVSGKAFDEARNLDEVARKLEFVTIEDD